MARSPAAAHRASMHTFNSLHGGLGCLGAVGYALYCAQTTRNPSSTPAWRPAPSLLMWQLPVGRRLSPPRAIAIPTRRSRWPFATESGQGVRCYRLAHFLLLHGALNLIHLTHAPTSLPLSAFCQVLRCCGWTRRCGQYSWRACAVP